MVSLMMLALSNCVVMAAGRGSSFASSKNSWFSLTRRDRAAFLLFSFITISCGCPDVTRLLIELLLSWWGQCGRCELRSSVSEEGLLPENEQNIYILICINSTVRMKCANYKILLFYFTMTIRILTIYNNFNFKNIIYFRQKYMCYCKYTHKKICEYINIFFSINYKDIIL